MKRRKNTSSDTPQSAHDAKTDAGFAAHDAALEAWDAALELSNVALDGETTAPAVLVVGSDAALLQQVRQAVQRAAITGRVESVEGFLTAIAHVGTGQPPAVLIGRADELGDEPAVIAQALRCVAPCMHLLLVTQPQTPQLADQMIDAGFDQCLFEPLAPDDLSQALAQSPPTDEADAPPAMLGDVDLIDKMLTGRRSILPLALKLIEQHANITGLDWSRKPTPAPRDHITASVTWRVNVWHSARAQHDHAANTGCLGCLAGAMAGDGAAHEQPLAHGAAR